MPERKSIGLIATFNGGLGTLRESGQESRIIDYYFRAYLRRFDHIYYFSYLSESLADFTSDEELLRRVTLLPRKSRMSSYLYAFWMPLAYRREFRACQVLRVFQATGVFATWPALLTRTPTLVTFGYYYSALARLMRKPAKTWFNYRFAEFWASRAATALLVTSRQLFRRLQPARGLRPVVLIPNGVDPSQFAPAPVATNHRETKTLCFVGRFEKEKNLETVLRAAAELQTKLPVRLLWVGKGSEEEKLRHLAAELKVALEIRPPMPHAELPEVFRRADAFTLLSWSEGNPKVLLEAMSAALPCVVSNCEGIRSLVENDQTAVVCSPENPSTISAQLYRILSTPSEAARIGEQARTYVQERFNLVEILERETKLLDQMAERTFPPRASRRGTWITRWLDYSVRRRLLDLAMAARADLFFGDVLEVGGSNRTVRGRFVRPWWQTRSWTTLNRDPETQPDVVGVMESMPLPDNRFDAVCCLETIEYSEDPGQAFREMRRVLKPGGFAVVSAPQMHRKDQPDDRWRLGAAQWRRSVELAGLQCEEVLRQGGILAGLAHLLKSSVAWSPRRGWRQLAGALILIPVELLVWFDQLVGSAGSDRTTGFVMIARKP